MCRFTLLQNMLLLTLSLLRFSVYIIDALVIGSVIDVVAIGDIGPIGASGSVIVIMIVEGGCDCS